MSIDFYRLMEKARTEQGTAWRKYTKLVNTPDATAEERLSAVREAFAADEHVTVAEYNWRSVNDLPT